MATHFNILAWRIPGSEEPGGLLSMGLHRVNTTEEIKQQQQQKYRDYFSIPRKYL